MGKITIEDFRRMKVAFAEVKLEMLVEGLMEHASRDDWIDIIKKLISTTEKNTKKQTILEVKEWLEEFVRNKEIRKEFDKKFKQER